MTNYANSKKNQEILKKSIIDQTESLFEDFLKKTQTELKGVPYPLSIYARKYFGTIEEFEKFNWVNHIQKQTFRESRNSNH